MAQLILSGTKRGIDKFFSIDSGTMKASLAKDIDNVYLDYRNTIEFKRGIDRVYMVEHHDAESDRVRVSLLRFALEDDSNTQRQGWLACTLVWEVSAEIPMPPMIQVCEFLEAVSENYASGYMNPSTYQYFSGRPEDPARFQNVLHGFMEKVKGLGDSPGKTKGSWEQAANHLNEYTRSNKSLSNKRYEKYFHEDEIKLLKRVVFVPAKGLEMGNFRLMGNVELHTKKFEEPTEESLGEQIDEHRNYNESWDLHQHFPEIEIKDEQIIKKEDQTDLNQKEEEVVGNQHQNPIDWLAPESYLNKTLIYEFYVDSDAQLPINADKSQTLESLGINYQDLSVTGNNIYKVQVYHVEKKKDKTVKGQQLEGVVFDVIEITDEWKLRIRRKDPTIPDRLSFVGRNKFLIQKIFTSRSVADFEEEEGVQFFDLKKLKLSEISPSRITVLDVKNIEKTDNDNSTNDETPSKSIFHRKLDFSNRKLKITVGSMIILTLIGIGFWIHFYTTKASIDASTSVEIDSETDSLAVANFKKALNDYDLLQGSSVWESHVQAIRDTFQLEEKIQRKFQAYEKIHKLGILEQVVNLIKTPEGRITGECSRCNYANRDTTLALVHVLSTITALNEDVIQRNCRPDDQKPAEEQRIYNLLDDLDLTDKERCLISEEENFKDENVRKRYVGLFGLAKEYWQNEYYNDLSSHDLNYLGDLRDLLFYRRRAGSKSVDIYLGFVKHQPDYNEGRYHIKTYTSGTQWNRNTDSRPKEITHTRDGIKDLGLSDYAQRLYELKTTWDKLNQK